MRFAKHLLPLALVLTGVIAAGDEETTTDAAKAKATITDEKATQTTADEADEADETKGTEESTATATGKDGDKDKDKENTDEDSETETGKSTGKAKATTTTTEEARTTVSWNPTIPATTAPDINGSSRSVQASGFLALTLVGFVSVAAAFL